MNLQDWIGHDNELGINIWKNKYQYNNESFDEWVERVSNSNEELKELILDKKFLFGGRILSNRGLEKEGKKITLSNCYVISPPDDNIESIFECGKKLARTFSFGGGCGIDISKLRPRDSRVNNAAKQSTGAVSFMDLYSNITDTISQNGRRGALMISISCSHPDLEEFIEVKSDLDKVTKANISIRINREFIEAVKSKSNYKLSFEIESTGEIIEKEVNAYDIFYKLSKMNWDYAEPGILNWDRIEKWNLLSNTKDFKFAGTNPCAEEPLPAGGSCLLGSINLSEFVENNKFDFNEFGRAVRTSTRALNEVLDEGLPLHPLEEQKKSVGDWRQIGLGIFGLGDMLIKLGIKYGSNDSLDLCDEIGKIMINESIKESAYLAQEFGTYPKYNYEDVSTTDFYKYNVDSYVDSLVKKYGLRNSQLLTIAPTGSLSTMLGVSGGIEPIFANYYTRKTESLHDKDTYYKVYTPIVKKYMEDNNIDDDLNLPDYFITAPELDYKDRINMQSVWQSHIDASISSTINLPKETSVEEVLDLYLYAFDSGLKGATIFRDGCKRIGVLTTGDEDTSTENLPRGFVKKPSENCIGLKRDLMTGCGSLHCQAFFDRDTGELVETYLSKGSTGGCNNFMVGLSRMISYASRGGLGVEGIVDQLNSTGTCSSYATRSAVHRDTSSGACCPMAVGRAIKSMYEEFQGLSYSPKKELNKEILEDEKNKCPVCDAELIPTDGCYQCKECGYSKCD